MGMDRVNLLPDEACLTPLERLLNAVAGNFVRVLGGTAGGIAAVGLLATLWQAGLLHASGRRLGALQEEIRLLEVESQNAESFSKQLDQVEGELRRQKKSLDAKASYLESVRGRQRRWAALLRELRKNIPQGVWLTDLETQAGGGLRIGGGATNEDLVTGFMANLKASAEFRNVGFSFTQKDSIGNISVVKFEIVCQAG